MTGLESGSMSNALETKQAEKQLSRPRVSPLAGKTAPKEMLVGLEKLERMLSAIRQKS
jgi:hypothetical protein